jgi:hypothetical protein
MHPFDLVCRVTFGGKIWPDGLVDNGDEADDIAQRHIWGRLNAVRLVLLQAGVKT